MAHPKVMLLDDDQAMLALMQDVLESQPVDVLAYWDPRLAKQALLVPKEKLPAVIVSDVMMPGIDGYSFLNSLREDELTRDIPVIVITAKRSMIDVFRDLPNVFAFLEKPFNNAVLLDTVQRALKKNVQA